MKRKNDKFLIILLSTLSFLLILFIFVPKFGILKFDSTADWKRHDFSEMGFSLALPPKWYPHDGLKTFGESWVSYPVDNPSPQGLGEGVAVGSLVANLSLAIYPNPDLTLDNDAKKRLADPYFPKAAMVESKLGGEKSIILRSEKLVFVLADHNGVRYYLQLGTDDSRIVKVFDQILSTFRFTE